MRSQPTGAVWDRWQRRLLAWPDRSQLRVEGGGRRLVADVYGSGPPVVLLHGQPGSALDWHGVGALLGDQFTVIVPDRLGYGRTGGDAADFEENASAVARLLDDLAVDRALVVGYSWSGGVALAFAGMFPARTAGLVLAASVGPGEHLRWEERLLAVRLVGETLALLTLGATGRVFSSRRVQHLVDRYLVGRPREAATAALSALTGGGAGTAVWRSFVIEQRVLLTEIGGLAPRLAAVAAPTAIVNGSADRVIPPLVADQLTAGIPGATHTVIAGAHHLLPHEQPEAIAAAVRQVAERAWPHPVVEDPPRP